MPWATVAEGCQSVGCLGGGDVFSWQSDTIHGRRRGGSARALALRSGLQPLSARTAQDPYPAYAALRDRAPVHHSRLLRAWVFTRHADVGAILRDHRRFRNDPRKGTLSSRQLAMLPPPHEFTLLFLDPPNHTRLRALVSKAFTPIAVNALEPRIRSILGALLDDIDDPSAFDLMEAVARPLPVIVHGRDAGRSG